jgi:hypothetical protein
MNKKKIIFFISIFSISSCAVYEQKIMQPWVGASKKELIEKWGYPQSVNDLIKISERISVYSYRSFREGFNGPAPCVVSFTIEEESVVAYKYEGSNCPRVER